MPPQFSSLSDAIQYQFQEMQKQRDRYLQTNSNLAQTYGLQPYRGDRFADDTEVLTWGVSRWGQAKVINKEKPSS
jgi:hypothetical protein